LRLIYNIIAITTQLLYLYVNFVDF
jgi:hypothetical protein